MAAVKLRAADSAPPVTGERYVGAVGSSLVYATLSVSETSIVGRWSRFRDDENALQLTSVFQDARGFELREHRADGRVTGEVYLGRVGQTWTGFWMPPGGASDGPYVRLARELRSRVGSTVVTAKALIMRHELGGTAGNDVAGFVPRVSGEGSEALAASLSLASLLDETEEELASTVALDFTVSFHDARFVTIEMTEETAGESPDIRVVRRTFAWSSGARVTVAAFLPERRAALARLLVQRVKSAWAAEERRRRGSRPPDTDCPSDVGPHIMARVASSSKVLLGNPSIDAHGVTFAFDFGLPRALAPCEPALALSVGWEELSRFIDPTGPLASNASGRTR